MAIITTLSLESSNSLVEQLYIVLQALSLLLMNGEKMGGVLLHDLAAYEIGNEKPA